MKKFNPFILAGLFVCSLSVSAFAGDPGFYAGVNVGLIVPSDVKMSSPRVSFDVSRKVGYAIGGAAGYDFGTNVRAEAEISYKANDTSELKDGNRVTGYNSTISALNFMANAYYDIHALHSFGVMPYAGGGVGVARLSNSNEVLPRSTKILLDSNDTVFAYQVGVGVAYDVSSKVTMDVGYRYFGTSDAKFNDNASGIVTMKYDSHNILAGLRYKF
jgi:opacity protein-like surface antigen